ncbi:hypothetical protein RM549_06600 [Salegentibacter sp. F188]|uniref:Carboxypeptidase-like regulatory domain-containing protein n=1 Tax=Autumnicola patrickiae TaxID=3075591 RepID=A0ABU3E0G6_9FLAO|nr:hypothetical protein [Salegentibacter sp. F188]MDT0689447.1 hypothetical protein [Salegentibacter sp. F188]
MKVLISNFLFLSLLVLTSVVGAQESRGLLDGRVLVPAGDDAGGITIFNKNLRSGTITDDNGDFEIMARQGDSLVFSAVQFNDFTIVVTENLMEERVMTINLNAAVNDLPEVKISDLSGIIEVDVKRIRVIGGEKEWVSTPELLRLKSMPERYRTGYVRNDAMGNVTASDYQGLNFANIFRAIFNQKGRNKENVEKLLPKEMANLIWFRFGEEYFTKTLNIAREHTSDFLFYVIDNGLTQEMLKTKNDLEIMQFLFEQKENFKQEF